MTVDSVGAARDESVVVDVRELVLLVHGAITPGGLRPLTQEASLAERYRVTHFDRAGYAGGKPADSIEEMVDDAAAALHGHPAHVVGHSIGAIIALQLALAHPALVQSLVLIEPTWATRNELLEVFEQAVAPAVDAYAAGDAAAAADHMMRLMDGDDYSSKLARILPEHRVTDAGKIMALYFEHDLRAAVPWRLSREQAKAIRKPILLLRGEHSPALYATIASDVLALLPQATERVIAGASHNVAATAPRSTADELAMFFDTVHSGASAKRG